MKVGDLVGWSEYEEVQYVPISNRRMGIIYKIVPWPNCSFRTIFVLAKNGERVTLYPQHTKIEVMSEK